MSDTKHEDHKFIVDHVVDDAVIADANTHLAVTAFELFASRWARVIGEVIDVLKDAPYNDAV